MLILLIIIINVIPDIIIWNCVFTAPTDEWKWLLLLPTTAIFFLMGAAMTTQKIRQRSIRLIIEATLFLTIPKLMFSVIAWPCGWPAGLAIAVVVILLFAYAFIDGWKKLGVKEETFVFPDLPKPFDGYRIMQVSDFHIGTFAHHPEFIEKIVETANSQNADLIVFTGDLVNKKNSEVQPFTATLAQLKAKDGVLSILGNHDYLDLSNVIKTEEMMGWQLLLNSHVNIRRGQHTLSVIGVEQTGKPPFGARGDLTKALAHVPHNAFKILLTHDPSHWRMEVLDTTDIQLTLSGHTHGGQLKAGRFSPARLIYREWGGLYTQQGRALYVSMGVGGRVPFRLGAWPELNLLTLKTGNDKGGSTP